ncbi:hypothetical protein STAS_05420 [Striga asiatica]|uniref:KIB1-4 beta-propeller domain-containing protein n=1 Tax=Striga asiatica TaxID=4170 RepID=A0A5A7P9M8_STRAF|nr:hypothetical protein STAS_05420 [Striga asiatica]
MAFSVRAALCSPTTAATTKTLSFINRRTPSRYHLNLLCRTYCAPVTATCSSSSNPKAAPLLMLPPALDNNNKKNLVFRFYKLAENQVISRRDEEEIITPSSVSDLSIVGSSHGWLSMLDDSKSGGLFLYNPLTQRRINLPPLPEGISLVTSLVLSGPHPDEDDSCRAVALLGYENSLAFCCPNSRTRAEWTQLGKRTGYTSVAYSTSQKRFFCFASKSSSHDDEEDGDGEEEEEDEDEENDDDDDEEDGDGEEEEEDEDEENDDDDDDDDDDDNDELYPHLEAWDLQDPVSPTMIPMLICVDKKCYPVAHSCKEEYEYKRYSCRDYQFLVVAEASGQLFHVRRFVKDWMGPKDYYAVDSYYGPKVGMLKDPPPYVSMGFDVHKYDPETGSLVYMDASLDGLAFFVGTNNGFALPAADHPGLKPDSVYYTEPPQWIHIGGHDVGIFDYKLKDFCPSPCFYPTDVQSTKTTCGPKWFTPFSPC